MGVERIPMVNVENAGATGATALHQAVMHVRSGAADVALAVGAEKLNIGDKEKSLDVFDGGVDVNDPVGLRETLKELGGAAPDTERSHSLFMDVYAALARAHMARHYNTRRYNSRRYNSRRYNNLERCNRSGQTMPRQLRQRAR